VVYEGAGHEFTEAMVGDSVKFVVELMEGGKGAEKGSKI
jgi:hypothetical protein